MNILKEILLCASRIVALGYLSVYVSPPQDYKNSSQCNRMWHMAVSIITICYCFVGLNVMCIGYYLYLLVRGEQASAEIHMLVKMEFQDVFMFFILGVNMLTLNFMFSANCGDLSERLFRVLTCFWIIIGVSAVFGYIIYKKIFLRINQNYLDTMQNAGGTTTAGGGNNRNDYEITLLDM